MSESRTSNRALLLLVIAGLAMMTCITVIGFRKEFAQRETTPSSSGITPPHMSASTDGNASRSAIRIERRKVPGLT